MNTTLNRVYKNWEKHPALVYQLRDGLLLAIAGRVKQDGNGWQVFSQGAEKRKPYRVTINPKNGWGCTCDFYGQAPSKVIPDFYGFRSIATCKHIAAVVLCQSSNYYPPAPANTWDLLSDLIAAQHVPAPGEAWQIPAKAV